MKRVLLILTLVTAFAFNSPAQHNKNFIGIIIKDNLNMQFTSYDYLVTKDSIVIKGDSDYGRSKVNYLHRKLTKEERKRLETFMKSYPADSLEDVYFNDYKNMSYISPDHFPRIIDMDIDYNGKHYKTKMTNCYAYKIANLCNFLNDFFPPEVRIKLIKEEFNAFFP